MVRLTVSYEEAFITAVKPQGLHGANTVSASIKDPLGCEIMATITYDDIMSRLSVPNLFSAPNMFTMAMLLNAVSEISPF